MIKFEGGLSEDCLNHIRKRFAKKCAIAGNIAMAVLSIIVVIIALQTTLLLLGCIIVFLAIGLVFSIPSMYSFDAMLPIEVVIEDDIISMESNDRYDSRDISNIQKILDGGSWYQVIFYYPYGIPCFAMEKDKIVEGTIQEFEEKFGDLIERINN